MTKRKTANNDPAEMITSSGDLQIIVPADGTKFTHFTKAIVLLNGDGSLSAVGSNGVTVTATGGLQTGVEYSMELEEIKNTGTGATLILGYF